MISKFKFIYVVLSILMIGLSGCSDSGPKKEVSVSYDSWEELDPRSPPPDKLRDKISRLLKLGKGTEVNIGDLVQIRLHTISPPGAASPQTNHDVTGWIWVGFNGEAPDEFRVWDNAFPAALIGLHQGTTATFLYRDFPYKPEARVAYLNWGDTAGYFGIPIFGDSQWFELQRPRMQKLASYAQQSDLNPGGRIFADIAPQQKAVTEVTIERVCTGVAQKRLITMVSSWPIRVAQDLGRTHTMDKPRYRYASEAVWEGICNDGIHARFQYGPIFVNTPQGKPDQENLDNEPYDWVNHEWESVPYGVVITPADGK